MSFRKSSRLLACLRPRPPSSRLRCGAAASRRSSLPAAVAAAHPAARGASTTQARASLAAVATTTSTSLSRSSRSTRQSLARPTSRLRMAVRPRVLWLLRRLSPRLTPGTDSRSAFRAPTAGPPGGYVIPRDDADKAAAAIKAAELDFTQRPFELSRPAQPKVDPRATKSLLGNLKRTLGLHHETVDSIEERSIGLQSTAGVRPS
jgi:hypothetical protein